LNDAELNNWLGLNMYIDETPVRYEKDESLPNSFDWRTTTKGTCIQPVRSQLNCGSCYAFSSTDTLADRSCIKYG